MYINTVRSKIRFGKYEGKLISELIKDQPSYIIWCIKNIDDFFVSHLFLREAIMINNSFRIPESDILIFIQKMKILRKIEDMDENDNDFPENSYHKFWLNSALIPELIAKEKIRLVQKAKDEEEKEIQLAEWRREDEEREMLNRELYDDSLYNDDLQADEQSDNFWNQF